MNLKEIEAVAGTFIGYYLLGLYQDLDMILPWSLISFEQIKNQLSFIIFFISGFQNPKGSIGPGLSSQTTYHSFLQKGQVTFKL